MRYLVFFLFISTTAFAQEVIPLEDSLTGNSDTVVLVYNSNVNVIKDVRLDALRRRPALMYEVNRITATKEKELSKLREERKGITNYDPIKTRNGKTVTGTIANREGFRIVIYSGTDKNKALEVKRMFMRRYPGIQSYFSYVAPYYKVRVGDFISKNDASKFMRSITGVFTKAFIVPDIVRYKDIHVR